MPTPPVITTPPIIFNAAVTARMDVLGSEFCGPFVIGTAQYVVIISQPVNPPPFHEWLNVYKSTDGGATWTSMDAANRPDTSLTAQPILNGTVFTIVYTAKTVGQALKVITFDTATDTFGAPSVDGPLTTGNARIAQYANGDLCIAYDAFGGTVHALIFSGGVFGVAVGIPNAKNSMDTVVMGTNNIAQIFYFDLQAPGLNVFFRTFTGGAVLGAEQNVFSASVVSQSALPTGPVILWNGNFILPAYGGVDGNQAGYWTGAPFTAPVWAFTLVDPVHQGPQPAAGDTDAFAFVDSSNNLILFWITLNSVPVVPVNQMSYAINSGSGFAAPVLFADETAHPETVDPVAVGNVLHTLSAARYANGKFGVVTAIDLTVPTPPPCAGFFLTGGAQSGCPKNAQGV